MSINGRLTAIERREAVLLGILDHYETHNDPGGVLSVHQELNRLYEEERALLRLDAERRCRSQFNTTRRGMDRDVEAIMGDNFHDRD